MFAVMKTGGKQYRVQSGDMLRVELLAADVGETVQFNEVLMVGSTVGAPLVEGAAVQAEVVDHIKDKKVINFVKRRRKHGSQRTKGHRQKLTLVRIGDIMESGSDKSGFKAAIGAGAVAGFVAVAAGASAVAGAAKSGAKKAAKAGAKAGAGAAKAVEAVKDVVSSADAEPTKPANLLTEARDGGPDDLKKISGVGPKLEGVLHENGVFHFDQIAAWGPSEVAYMDDQLSFKGRIDRDDWIAQASEFAAAK